MAQKFKLYVSGFKKIMNVNKVILVGNITHDPELRSTSSGSSVARVGLATNRYWNDKNGQKQEKVEFHNLVLFGRLAEIAGRYLTKGQQAYFEGRLQTRNYTAKDGTERRITEIIVENMQLGRKSQGAGQVAGEYSSQSSAPARSNFNEGNQTPNQSFAKAKEEEIPTINLDDDQEEIKIEDVPF